MMAARAGAGYGFTNESKIDSNPLKLLADVRFTGIGLFFEHDFIRRNYLGESPTSLARNDCGSRHASFK